MLPLPMPLPLLLLLLLLLWMPLDAVGTWENSLPSLFVPRDVFCLNKGGNTPTSSFCVWVGRCLCV